MAVWQCLPYTSMHCMCPGPTVAATVSSHKQRTGHHETPSTSRRQKQNSVKILEVQDTLEHRIS